MRPRGPPSRRPCDRRASPARMRSAMRARSNSLIAPTICHCKRPGREELRRRQPILLPSSRCRSLIGEGPLPGQTVEFSGTVESIGNDILGTTYVTLKGGEDAFGNVQAMFARSDESELAR